MAVPIFEYSCNECGDRFPHRKLQLSYRRPHVRLRRATSEQPYETEPDKARDTVWGNICDTCECNLRIAELPEGDVNKTEWTTEVGRARLLADVIDAREKGKRLKHRSRGRVRAGLWKSILDNADPTETKEGGMARRDRRKVFLKRFKERFELEGKIAVDEELSNIKQCLNRSFVDNYNSSSSTS